MVVIHFNTLSVLQCTVWTLIKKSANLVNLTLPRANHVGRRGNGGRSSGGLGRHNCCFDFDFCFDCDRCFEFFLPSHFGIDFFLTACCPRSSIARSNFLRLHFLASTWADVWRGVSGALRRCWSSWWNMHDVWIIALTWWWSCTKNNWGCVAKLYKTSITAADAHSLCQQ